MPLVALARPFPCCPVALLGVDGVVATYFLPQFILVGPAAGLLDNIEHYIDIAHDLARTKDKGLGWLNKQC